MSQQAVTIRKQWVDTLKLKEPNVQLNGRAETPVSVTVEGNAVDGYEVTVYLDGRYAGRVFRRWHWTARVAGQRYYRREVRRAKTRVKEVLD